MARRELSGFLKPHTLTFHAGRVEFVSPMGEQTTVILDGTQNRIEGSGWDPQTVLLGYGATRLLPRGNHQATPRASNTFSVVDNLFDPFVPLLDAERWLLGLDLEAFNKIAMIIRDLLSLPPDATLVREEGRVVVVAHHARVPLRHLSDGYQSVLATIVDILDVAQRLWPNPQEAEGIVLLDEVGAHLHPTWKMRIVTSLRDALPRMQFLTTTHDPLCLRGLGSGEVAVLRRREEDSRVVLVSGLPSPGDFRVDQLLTSDFFGLNSTVDVEVDSLFDEYYALLALLTPTSEEQLRTAKLHAELKGRRHLGNTLRENLMYDAIDHLVAKHRNDPDVASANISQEAIDQVAMIWHETMPQRGGRNDQD